MHKWDNGKLMLKKPYRRRNWEDLGNLRPLLGGLGDVVIGLHRGEVPMGV
jgi:hypothetical protein